MLDAPELEAQLTLLTAQELSAWCESTVMLPSEEPQARMRPSSCGAKHTLFTEAACNTELYTCSHEHAFSTAAAWEATDVAHACLRPDPCLGLLPDDDSAVKAAGGQEAPKLWVRPRHLPDWALVAQQLCLGRGLVCYVKHLCSISATAEHR